MGLDFFVGEVQAQANDATRVAQAATQAVGLLQDSVSQFLNAPLSSKTYDTAKRYFSVAYPPLRQGVVLASEALTQAHQKFLSEYASQVGGGDIQEDELRDRINQGRELMGAIQDLISKEEEWNPRLERRYENAMMAVQKLEERLQKLYAFNASSASIFSEYESCLAQLNTGISAIANSGAWNASSGTFNVQKMDMRWAKPITTRWQAREKMRQEKLKKAENEAVNLLKKHGLSKADLVQKTDSPEVIAQKYIRFSQLGLHPHTGEALPKEDRWKFQYAAHSNTLFETLGIAGGAYAAQKAANAGFYTQPNALAGTKNGKQYTLNKGQSPKGFKTFKKASGAGDIFKRTPEIEKHLKYTDPSVPRKRGIGGAHNSEEFFKNDVKVIKQTSTDVPGVSVVEYQIPELDAKGLPTGNYKKTIFKKSIYDPSIIPDDEYIKRGLEAANDAIKNNNGSMNREWIGKDSSGKAWRGFFKDGKIDTFFPD